MTITEPPIDNTPRVPRGITDSRIANFIAAGSIFYSMGIHRGLWINRHTGPPHVTLSVYSVPDLKEAVGQKFVPVGQHERTYGPSWATYWFKVEVVIPEALNNKQVVLYWDMGCEGMVWSVDGEPLQGLTGGDDQQRHEYIVTNNGKTGTKHTFYIEAACNGMFGVGNASMVPDPNRYYSIKTADLVAPNPPIQALYHDLTIIKGIADDTDRDSARARSAVWVINEIINHFYMDDPAAIQKCRELASAFLSVKNGSPDGQHKITAVGNCHIDTAWLWPYDETKRKIARSWSSQLDLMDRYKDYVFTGSQVQQYEWLQEYYPTVFEKIKQKEKTGQWEIIGGSWVEHGKYKYAKWRIAVPPDGPGVCKSISLPQVLKQSGCDYFFTQKLSWNNINKFPLSTFWWVGIDGTKILAHLTPAETYNASVTVSELVKCSKNHHDLEFSNESLLCYGHGDGGGGPTPAMLERLKRLNDVDGLPICKPGSAISFFEGIAANSKRLQAYHGELYLEFHRGTYTTQALVKQGNRRSEILLRDVEILATTAALLLRKQTKNYPYSYPVDDLERLWKLLCLNQFHDCLPGSAIGLAFKDQHREIISESLVLRDKAQSAIINSHYEIDSTEKDAGDNEGLVVFNTLPWKRTDVIALPVANTAWVRQQYTADGHEYVLGNGRTVRLITNTLIAYTTNDGHFVLENTNLKATFNADGQLLELVDKHTPERQSLVPQGCRGNVLQLYEDVPIYWDAWDVEIYHFQKFKVVEGKANLKASPLVAELQFSQQISEKSEIKQIIRLTCVGERIEFENRVDWHESHQFLKVEFIWDLVSDHATYEVQYGALRRPTHYNTSVDSAKFEVCGHRFADLSESNYGVALINDCKYGYATHGNMQRLSLLRSPKGPDENADMGEHQFSYAIYPHKNHFVGSDVVRHAIEFNVPLSFRVAKGNQLKKGIMLDSLFRIDPPHQVILDTVKPAEDDAGEGNIVILRLYEAYGGRASAKLYSSPLVQIKHLMISNVLEDDTALAINQNSDGSYSLDLHPHQILTLKLITC
ncbi:galactose mutarotase-like domain-containing protein [Dichotomocladium elegans]|nr:galactose mutarotase-like domain-containing protein [Dichotomocladium elegans]